MKSFKEGIFARKAKSSVNLLPEMGIAEEPGRFNPGPVQMPIRTCKGSPESLAPALLPKKTAGAKTPAV
jgi:hypothetical protein